MFDLKESDLPELERLAADGYKWIARDKDGRIKASAARPRKERYLNYWLGVFTSKHCYIEEKKFPYIHWSDHEPLNIAAAIAQIKAQTKPITNKDVLLRLWTSNTEAMARELIEIDLEDGGYFFHNATTKSGTGYTRFYQVALQEEIAYLNSPYKEATDD